MFKNLDMLQTSMAMARHAGQRQAVTAANLANADTPGYRARELGSFSESFDQSAPANLRQTRTGHLSSTANVSNARERFADAEASPNGNTVSIEEQMLSAVEIQREHNRALAIYQHSLDVLRISIGRK